MSTWRNQAPALRLDMSLTVALSPPLPHALDVMAVEDIESKWDSGETGPIYPW